MSDLLTELRKCIITGLSSVIPSHLKFSEAEMETMVMRIYSFSPTRRFSIIKYLTLKWLLDNDFLLKWNNAVLSNIENILMAELESTDSFNLQFKGLLLFCHFSNFSEASVPEYRITLIPEKGDPLSIKLYKKFVPLFEPKNEPHPADEFFIRELNMRFVNSIQTRIISPILCGVPLASPHTTEGPSLTCFPEIMDANLSTTPPPTTMPLNVQPGSLDQPSISARARSRSPITPLTPGRNIQLND